MTSGPPSWTPDRERRLKEVWHNKDIKLKAIAAEMGISTSALSQYARKLNLKPRYAVKRDINATQVMAACHFNSAEIAYMEHAAETRKMTVSKLVRKILRTVVTESMIDAVLDDAEINIFTKAKMKTFEASDGR
jgi:predicted transcriptional regulator